MKYQTPEFPTVGKGEGEGDALWWFGSTPGCRDFRCWNFSVGISLPGEMVLNSQ